jgi:isopentenyldiphosphate isomerase
MAENKTISVWLKDDQDRVVLQKRSETSNSFPFICQATWAGKVEPGEDTLEAVKRECSEELGKEFCDGFDFRALKLFLKGDFKAKDSDWTSYNYFGRIGKEDLQSAKLHSEALPNFVFLAASDKYFPIKKGENPENNIVLFNDQYEALKSLWK